MTISLSVPWRHGASVLTTLLLCAHAGAAVSVTEEDVDGDTAPEIILQNNYIRVALDRGVPPAGGEVTRYTDRFVWGGWIRDLAFLPSGRHFLLQAGEVDDINPLFTGMPEEFEQIVPLGKPLPTNTNRVYLLKVGVGICSGVPSGDAWKQIRVEQPTPWTVSSGVLSNGVAQVTFSQIFAPTNGLGYEYVKTFTLEPGASALRVNRRLTNRGTQPIATSWYIHPFFPQDESTSSSEACWATAPIRVGEHPADVDTKSCTVLRPDPLGIWGSLAGRSIPEPWYATGRRNTGEFLVTRTSRRIEWLRIWTAEHCYALEPFSTIDLAPGQTWEQTVTHTAARGLQNVSGVGQGITVDLSRTADRVTVSLITDRAREGIDVSLSLNDQQSGRLIASLRFTTGRMTPQAPWSEAFTIEHAGPMVAEISAGVPDADDPLIEVQRILSRMPDVLIAATGCRALVLTEPQNDKGKPQDDMGYLVPYLKWSGMSVREFNVQTDDLSSLSLEQYDCVVVAGSVTLPVGAEAWLERYLLKGGGLFQGGPVSLLGGTMAEILPAVDAGDPYKCTFLPYGPNRKFGEISEHRLHLQTEPSARSHPIVRGLPLWPYVGQDIGQATRLRPRPEGRVILRFTDDSPALLTRSDPGRVVVLACPLCWGMPPVWVNYARVGEYHRELLIRCVLWAAGRL